MGGVYNGAEAILERADADLRMGRHTSTDRQRDREMHPAVESSLTALDLLVVAGLLLLGVLVARMPILTPDVWWHLATGRLIAESGIPHSDPFSYTLAGQHWTAHEWLADRVLYGVYAAAGLLGVVFLRAALLSAAFAVAYRVARLQAGALTALLLLIAAAYASQRNWLDRPQLWSFLLAPLLLWLLERARTGRTRSLLALPPLFAVWVNLHGGFMLGLGIVGLWLLAAFVSSRFSRKPADLRPLALSALLSVVATLANPNHIEGASYPLRYVASGLGATLQEERVGTLDSPFAWVRFGLVAALWLLFAVRRGRVPLAHVGLGVFLGWISMPRLLGVELPFAAERHAPLFLLLGTPLLAWHLTPVLPRRATRTVWLRSRPAWIVAALVVVGAGVFAARALPLDARPEARLLPARYPERAARWLREQRLPGHLINPYRWGAYLAFELYPEYRVWIDSRGDLYGIDRLREYELLHRVPPGSERAVQELLERYDANLIVWHLLTLDFGPLQVHPFASLLLRSSEWRLVYYDDRDPRNPQRPFATSAIFLREHPRNAEHLARYPAVRPPRLPRAPRR
jgi:hypothetical protein